MIIPSTPHFHDPSSCSLVMVKSTPKTASFSEPCFRSRKLSWARSSPSIATLTTCQTDLAGALARSAATSSARTPVAASTPQVRRCDPKRRGRL